MTTMWAARFDDWGDEDFFCVKRNRSDVHDFFVQCHNHEKEPDVSRRNIIRRQRRRGLRAVKVRIVRA